MKLLEPRAAVALADGRVVLAQPNAHSAVEQLHRRRTNADGIVLDVSSAHLERLKPPPDCSVWPWDSGVSGDLELQGLFRGRPAALTRKPR